MNKSSNNYQIYNEIIRINTNAILDDSLINAMKSDNIKNIIIMPHNNNPYISPLLLQQIPSNITSLTIYGGKSNMLAYINSNIITINLNIFNITTHIFNYIPYTVQNITISNDIIYKHSTYILNKLPPSINSIYISRNNNYNSPLYNNLNNLPVLLCKLIIQKLTNANTLPPIKELYIPYQDYNYYRIEHKIYSLPNTITTLEIGKHINLINSLSYNIQNIIINYTLIDIINIQNININKYPNLKYIYVMIPTNKKTKKIKNMIKYLMQQYCGKINIYLYERQTIYNLCNVNSYWI